jgi:hypothetical protein
MNFVGRSDMIVSWIFGLGAWMANLAAGDLFDHVSLSVGGISSRHVFDELQNVDRVVKAGFDANE